MEAVPQAQEFGVSGVLSGARRPEGQPSLSAGLTGERGQEDVAEVAVKSKNCRSSLQICRFVSVSLLIVSSASTVRAQAVVATITSSTPPKAVVANSVTNNVYLATTCRSGFGGQALGVVDLIDGNSNTATLVVTASACFATAAMGLNSVTDMVYVANPNGDITVIDGATNSTTTITGPDTTAPQAAAVNAVTNKVYVAYASGNVIVIDGATNSTTTVSDPNASGLAAAAVAVNAVTNKIYVAYNNSNGGTGAGNVTVIDGVTNNTTTITDPNAVSPAGLAVNTLTNKIYVTNSSNITVIDGTTNTTTTITDPNAVSPAGMDVNSTTNKVYVANSGSNNVTVIDGTNNSTTTVTDPNAVFPASVAVNSTTNEIYVGNRGNCCSPGSNPGSVTVIDGATNSVTTVIIPNVPGPLALALDPTNDKIYVVNHSPLNGDVTVIEGSATAATHTLGVVLTSSGEGTVTSSPSGITCSTGPCFASFVSGTAVGLTASPISGVEFSGWSTNCTGTSACSVTMNSDAFVTASFNFPPDFSLQPASGPLTAQAGGQVTAGIIINPMNGSFSNAIQLSCTVMGSTPLATCSLSPTSVTPGANSVTSTLTVTAPTQSASVISPQDVRGTSPLYAVFLPIPFALMALGLAGDEAKNRTRGFWALCWLLIAFAALQAGCGGGSSSPPPALNYTVTVTATSGAIQHTTQISVNVP